MQVQLLSSPPIYCIIRYMHYKLTDTVSWGNWTAPNETIGQFNTIINVAHHFSPRRGRNVYWANLQNLPHTIYYYRIALRDRDDITPEYANALASAIDASRQSNKLPILTHCQMGGHRGPSAAMFTAWHLGGRKANEFETLHKRTLELFPRLENGSNYYHSTLDYCRSHSVK